MELAIEVIDAEELRVLSVRRRVDQAGIPSFIGGSIGELMGRLALLGVEPTGAPFVVYHEFGPHGIEAEVCVPVPNSVDASGGLLTRVIPRATVVRALHVGPYDQLGAAYQAIEEWIGDHHMSAAGPYRERYLNAPDEVASPAEYRTEIELPVVAAPEAVPV